jgi:hypothetical protein
MNINGKDVKPSKHWIQPIAPQKVLALVPEMLAIPRETLVEGVPCAFDQSELFQFSKSARQIVSQREGSAAATAAAAAAISAPSAAVFTLKSAMALGLVKQAKVNGQTLRGKARSEVLRILRWQEAGQQETQDHAAAGNYSEAAAAAAAAAAGPMQTPTTAPFAPAVTAACATIPDDCKMELLYEPLSYSSFGNGSGSSRGPKAGRSSRKRGRDKGKGGASSRAAAATQRPKHYVLVRCGPWLLVMVSPTAVVEVHADFASSSTGSEDSAGSLPAPPSQNSNQGWKRPRLAVTEAPERPRIAVGTQGDEARRIDEAEVVTWMLAFRLQGGSQPSVMHGGPGLLASPFLHSDAAAAAGTFDTFLDDDAPAVAPAAFAAAASAAGASAPVHPAPFVDENDLVLTARPLQPRCSHGLLVDDPGAAAAMLLLSEEACDECEITEPRAWFLGVLNFVFQPERTPNVDQPPKSSLQAAGNLVQRGEKMGYFLPLIKKKHRARKGCKSDNKPALTPFYPSSASAATPLIPLVTAQQWRDSEARGAAAEPSPASSSAARVGAASVRSEELEGHDLDGDGDDEHDDEEDENEDEEEQEHEEDHEEDTIAIRSSTPHGATAGVTTPRDSRPHGPENGQRDTMLLEMQVQRAALRASAAEGASFCVPQGAVDPGATERDIWKQSFNRIASNNAQSFSFSLNPDSNIHASATRPPAGHFHSNYSAAAMPSMRGVPPSASGRQMGPSSSGNLPTPSADPFAGVNTLAVAGFVRQLTNIANNHQTYHQPPEIQQLFASTHGSMASVPPSHGADVFHHHRQQTVHKQQTALAFLQGDHRSTGEHRAAVAAPAPTFPRGSKRGADQLVPDTLSAAALVQPPMHHQFGKST